MPTSSKVKKKLFSLLPELKIDGKVYELGSGWGHLVFSLSRKYPNQEIYGYEISLFPWLVSRIIQLFFFSNKKIKIRRKNFYNISLKEANLIICYLFPNAMEKLKEKFNSELREETILVSHCFAIPGWKPEITCEVNDIYRSKIFIYRFKKEQIKII